MHQFSSYTIFHFQSVLLSINHINIVINIDINIDAFKAKDIKKDIHDLKILTLLFYTSNRTAQGLTHKT